MVVEHTGPLFNLSFISSQEKSCFILSNPSAQIIVENETRHVPEVCIWYMGYNKIIFTYFIFDTNINCLLNYFVLFLITRPLINYF